MELVPTSNPVLYTKCIDFEVGSEDLEKLEHVMLAKMRKHNGIGLAAPQIGRAENFFVMGDSSGGDIFINPIIREQAGDPTMMTEGCLTFPGLYLKIKRPEKVVVEYTNTKGDRVERSLDGLWARCFQHEYDHLQGICYYQHVSKLAFDIAMRKLNKRLKRMK